MDLIIPDSGLIIWQAIIFLIVLLILRKFAWKPILGALSEREASIENALLAAENAKKEMANLKAENEKLLEQARLERDNILKGANEAAKQITEDAKTEASKISSKMIEDAKLVIDTEKKAALSEVKNQVALLTIEVTEKILRKNLSEDKAQQELVEGYVKDLKLN
ncbi:F0F1 ATP synthase subunit B [Penaeicola halotolerans]|uniref:F0F1 ATP synthase subunit B n=1 Tax=Penaeicola halotolerans TaxID=2793196 RepID=UPI001CF8D6D6|nr:F0F1 ATP synthase subunit B [Penaeicola halotolerans]